MQRFSHSAWRLGERGRAPFVAESSSAACHDRRTQGGWLSDLAGVHADPASPTRESQKLR
jgi:hypothetical protein